MISNYFYRLFDEYIGKDMKLETALKYGNKETLEFDFKKFYKDYEKVGEDILSFIATYVITYYKFDYLLKLCFEQGILINYIHDSIKARKPYYEFIDKKKIKANFGVIFSSYTGENIVNRPLTFVESDPDKLMTLILKHTKEEMGMVDFLKGIVTFEYLKQDFSVTGLVGGI